MNKIEDIGRKDASELKKKESWLKSEQDRGVSK